MDAEPSGREAGGSSGTGTPVTGPSARRWSAAAGGYGYVAGVALFEGVFAPFGDTFAQFLGLPRLAAVAVVAVPLWAFGAVMWFGVVEEPGNYTYPAAAVYGVSTTVPAVLTVVGLFGLIFGPVVYVGWFVVAFMLAVSTPVVLGVALTSMLVRRRWVG